LHWTRFFISVMICRSTSKFHQPEHSDQKTNVGHKPQVQEEEVLTEEKLRPSQGQGMFVIRFFGIFLGGYRHFCT
jgi:hypothetical protein